jgi:hypothetical protein
MRRLLVVGLFVGGLSCKGVPLLAPSGSTIELFGNPTFIATNGGVCVIRAFLTRPDGQTVADGTVVEFFTDLGNINPPQGKTNDGIAIVSLVSDGRSGTAHVQGFSGGPSSGGTTATSTVTASTLSRFITGLLTTTTTTTTTIATTTPIITTTPAPTVGAGLAEGNPISILIGSVNAASIQLIVQPPKIFQGRPGTVLANVYDPSGNPLANVPVFFSINPVTPTEYLASGGSPIFTDNNGQAFDTIYTKQDPSNPENAVTVMAQVPGGPSQVTTVFVN